jgi:DNA repair protein RadC
MLPKPREKLAELGPASLEDYELVSILLSRGNRSENVFAISKRLLKGFVKDDFVHEKNVAALQTDFKIGFVQACQLIACFELGKRFFAKNSSNRIVQSAAEAYELNSRHKVIHDEVISIGSLDANIIHPREIFRPAIEYGAYAIILAHNHPSGDYSPSNADLEVTKKLREIGDLMQIPIIDHLIIGNNNYTSLNKFIPAQSSNPKPGPLGLRAEL